MPSTATAPAAKLAKKALPKPDSDFYQLAETLNAEEHATLKQVRAFMETKVAPVINKYWADDAFPFELVPAFKDLNIGGLGLEGYECRGGGVKRWGLVGMERSRADASFRAFFGGSDRLAVRSLFFPRSRGEKKKWLPPMARFEKIGSFALTEPEVGSGAAGGLTTTAKREGDTWVLNGQKKWIGNATWGDVTIVWARDLADNQVKGFIVENKTTPGFSVEKIERKIALKVVQNGLITLKDARMRETVAWARELFGANGIVVDSNVARFFADAEALYSYEGTFQMQNLIVGKAVTGLSAFV